MGSNLAKRLKRAKTCVGPLRQEEAQKVIGGRNWNWQTCARISEETSTTSRSSTFILGKRIRRSRFWEKSRHKNRTGHSASTLTGVSIPCGQTLSFALCFGNSAWKSGAVQFTATPRGKAEAKRSCSAVPLKLVTVTDP